MILMLFLSYSDVHECLEGIELPISLQLGATLTTICPRSSRPFYIISYYIKWVTTSWKHGKKPSFLGNHGQDIPICTLHSVSSAMF